MKAITLFSSLAIIILSCNRTPDAAKLEQWKREVIETEKAFADLAGEAGIKQAFIAYAAPDAVLMRNNQLVTGDTGIASYLGKQKARKDELLEWHPDFVDVSNSGDLAYTFGEFTYSFVDSTGSTIEHKGIFHTVWKRQADGSWKFVWD